MSAEARVLRVGLMLPMFSGDPAKVIGAAQAAERLGFDGVFAFDHFFPPGAAPDRPSLEAFTTLGAVAASTDRVALGTLVARAILRPVGLVARMFSSLDVISGGRAILGLGTGDPIDRPEHRAFGFPDLSARARQAHLGETVAALKALFGGKGYEGGEFVPPVTGPLLPPPVREGGPPVWLGALSDDVVRMAGRIADGWNGWGLAPAEFRRKVEILRAESAESDRVDATWAGIVLVGEDEEEVSRLLAERQRKGMADGVAWAGEVDGFVAHLRELAEAGASWAILVLAGPADRRELLAERILPALATRPSRP